MTHTVALAIPQLDAGGPDRVISELLHGLPRDRFALQLIVQRAGGRLFDALPGDIQVDVIGDGRRYPVVAYRGALARLEPDLVMTTLRLNITAGLARKLFGHPPILVARQANAIAANFAELRQRAPIKQRIVQPIVTHALLQADAMIAQSQDMAAELQSETRGAIPLATIGNPVSLPQIDALAAGQQHACVPPRGSPALVAVGRLMPQKGFDVLIDALPAVLARHPAAMLTIYGEGPDESALRRRAAQHGIADHVVFAGHSAHVQAQVASADLYVSSSRYEGFSNAILEAMALGAVIVATDCPGATREMIDDGRSGFLVPVDDSSALAAGILRALDAASAGIGANARAAALQNYDRAAICASYTRFFESLLDARAR